ncbi:hypothetical protein C8Q78DRAFT_714391 [Trametes maxima]|nr:hypothetical protein C8Q78DRAFT_714391 [Trametes maxima]
MHIPHAEIARVRGQTRRRLQRNGCLASNGVRRSENHSICGLRLSLARSSFDIHCREAYIRQYGHRMAYVSQGRSYARQVHRAARRRGKIKRSRALRLRVLIRDTAFSGGPAAVVVVPDGRPQGRTRIPRKYAPEPRCWRFVFANTVGIRADSCVVPRPALVPLLRARNLSGSIPARHLRASVTVASVSHPARSPFLARPIRRPCRPRAAVLRHLRTS